MKECLSSIAYTLRADIYRPLITQDVTGIVIKQWRYERTVSCSARSIIRKGMGQSSNSLDIYDYINIFNSMVKLRCNRVIPSDRIVVNIRNDDQVIYQENQDPATEGGYNTSTIFDVRGSTPLLNYDGSILEYETILMRREIQEMTVG